MPLLYDDSLDLHIIHKYTCFKCILYKFDFTVMNCCTYVWFFFLHSSISHSASELIKALK